MAGKKRVRFRGTKHTSKRLESDILERSRSLAENPGLLRPMCAGNCRKCAFDKTFKTIDAISRIRSADALVKEASKGGDDIAKAYAGTVSLQAAGSVPMLATAKLGGETVSFAIRGQVGNDKLIGCQHYDDPKIRLLLYNQFVKKNKLHLYSFEGGLVCSDAPNMPEDYLYETFWETPYEFRDDGLDCGHDSPAALVIRVKSLDQRIRICSDCAREVSSLQFIISQMCAVDPLDDIEVWVEHKYHESGGDGRDMLPKDSLQKYARGELNDRSVLSLVTRDRLVDLKKSGRATYIVGSSNYGSDLKSFMASLSGTEHEKAALELFLSDNNESLVLKSPRASEALCMLWSQSWKDIISRYTSDETLASLGDMSRTNPAQALAEARYRFIMSDVVSSLPVFKRPGPVTRLADVLAKAAKVGGAEMVRREVSSINPRDSAGRIMSAAFIRATDPEGHPPWKPSKDEDEYSAFIMPFVEKVIEAEPGRYADAMNTLLTASGSGESV